MTQETCAPPRLAVTADEAAAMLAVHVSTVWRWLKEGQLPSSLIGGCRRIRISDIEALLATNSTGQFLADESEPKG